MKIEIETHIFCFIVNNFPNFCFFKPEKASTRTARRVVVSLVRRCSSGLRARDRHAAELRLDRHPERRPEPRHFCCWFCSWYCSISSSRLQVWLLKRKRVFNFVQSCLGSWTDRFAANDDNFGAERLWIGEVGIAGSFSFKCSICSQVKFYRRLWWSSYWNYFSPFFTNFMTKNFKN